MAKSTTLTKPAANKPAQEIRSGAIRCTIWRNASEKGDWYSTTITRSFKVGEEWKETSQFNRDDLPVVSKLCDLAFGWILEQK